MKLNLKAWFAIFFLIATVSLWATDPPGGLLRTAESRKPGAYEVHITPGYLLSLYGAYLSSEFRFQPSEDFGTGLLFGAGEAGYHVGFGGTWFISPDLENQPAFSLTGAVLLNQLSGARYFVTRVTPTVSKRFGVEWGKITPYTGVHLAPSFRLGEPQNEFSLKWSVGTEYQVKALNRMNLWTEFNLSIINSVNEILFGISYPLESL